MIKEFEQLEPGEKDLMFSLPIYVAILVAGADGTIDSTEIHKSISIAKHKTKKARKDLLQYYNVVNENFEDKIKMTIANLPSEVKEREQALVKLLEDSNKVFAALDKVFAIKLYASLRDSADQVAKASGGIFGYLSIGYEESRVVELKMIKDPAA